MTPPHGFAPLVESPPTTDAARWWHTMQILGTHGYVRPRVGSDSLHEITPDGRKAAAILAERPARFRQVDVK